MSAAGILNHQITAGQALAGLGATPMDSSTTGTTGTSGTSSSSDTSGDSAIISANDFLTLLVTEMQNQDPTADTDPNEYIDQLVDVNSLEQLIQINQTLSTDLTSPSTSSTSGSPSAQATGAVSGLAGASPASATATPHALAHAASSAAVEQTSTAGLAPGNLSVPRANPAARRVIHALDGRTHAQPASGSVGASQ